MSNMKYKGYIGSVEVDEGDDILFGKLLFIKDLVNYEADGPKSLRVAFEESIEGYLNDCKEQNIEPDKPFKGSFNLRVAPETHRSLALGASSKGITLNEHVNNIITEHLTRIIHEAA